MNISIIAASNNKNLELAYQLDKIVQQMGHNTRVIDLVAQDIPLYTPKHQSEKGVPEQIQELASIFLETDAMIFVAPEYNGGIPPVLTSAIAWLSVKGDDWRGYFNGKSAALATHSGGNGNHVIEAMRSQFSYIGMNLVGRSIVTNGQKPLSLDSAQQVIKQLIKIT